MQVVEGLRGMCNKKKVQCVEGSIIIRSIEEDSEAEALKTWFNK